MKKKVTKLKNKKYAGGGNLGNILGGIAGGVSGIATTAIQAAQIDADSQQAKLQEAANQQTNASTLSELQNLWGNSLLADTDITSNAIRGMTNGQKTGSILSATAQGATAGAVLGPWGALAGGVIGLGSGVAGVLAGDAKARREAARLNREGALANMNLLENVQNSAEMIKERELNQALINRVANGGKIYIKPSKRGTFTAAAKQRGLGVQEFASKVLANKENYSTTMVRKANFARNASKWHPYGGPLFNLSGDFDNGLMFINEGGTHEQNPYEGVQIGVDMNNTPNLVEEGEVIYNDYVFSNRLKPTKKQLVDGGFTDKYNGWTFAKIVEDLQKESSERPNDVISKAGLEDMLSRITIMQENIRSKKDNSTNMFPTGGILKKAQNSLLPIDLSNANEELTLISEGLDNSFTPLDNKVNLPRFTSDGTPIWGTYDATKPITSSSKKSNYNWASTLRYAPAVMNAGLAVYNAAKKPDYSNAESIVEAANRIPIATYTPVGGKQTYTPVDRNYLLNKYLNSSNVAARNIQNTALTGNQALAYLTNLNATTQAGIGDAYLQADRENFARQMQAAQFNLGIDQINNQLALQAQQMNQARANTIADATVRSAMLREQIDAQRAAAISSTLTGVGEDLGGIGTEAEYNRWLSDLAASGALRDYRPRKNGGMLTRRRK